MTKSNAEIIRNYMTTINPIKNNLLEDKFILYSASIDKKYPIKYSLNESTGSLFLSEGEIFDKLVATGKKIKNKVQEFTPNMINAAINKAKKLLDSLASSKKIDPKGEKVILTSLEKMETVGRSASKSKIKLLLVMSMVIGLTGIMANNPAHAEDFGLQCTKQLLARGDDAGSLSFLKHYQDCVQDKKNDASYADRLEQAKKMGDSMASWDANKGKLGAAVNKLGAATDKADSIQYK